MPTIKRPRRALSPEASRLNKRANEHDVDVGERLRLVRGARGISQPVLSRALGVSFQQVQKYEAGTDRISAVRLYEISRLLKVDLGFFFHGFADPVSRTGKPLALGSPSIEFEGYLAQIKDKSVRKRLLELLHLLGPEHDT